MRQPSLPRMHQAARSRRLLRRQPLALPRQRFLPLQQRRMQRPRRKLLPPQRRTQRPPQALWRTQRSSRRRVPLLRTSRQPLSPGPGALITAAASGISAAVLRKAGLVSTTHSSGAGLAPGPVGTTAALGLVSTGPSSGGGPAPDPVGTASALGLGGSPMGAGLGSAGGSAGGHSGGYSHGGVHSDGGAAAEVGHSASPLAAAAAASRAA